MKPSLISGIMLLLLMSCSKENTTEEDKPQKTTLIFTDALSGIGFPDMKIKFARLGYYGEFILTDSAITDNTGRLLVTRPPKYTSYYLMDKVGFLPSVAMIPGIGQEDFTPGGIFDRTLAVHDSIISGTGELMFVIGLLREALLHFDLRITTPLPDSNYYHVYLKLTGYHPTSGRELYSVNYHLDHRLPAVALNNQFELNVAGDLDYAITLNILESQDYEYFEPFDSVSKSIHVVTNGHNTVNIEY